MPYPRDLDAWGYATLCEVVREHWGAEPGEIDFRAVLNPTGGDGNYTNALRRTAASMANAGGGVIIFGVVEPTDDQRRRFAVEQDPEPVIIGVPATTEWRADLGRKLAPIDPPLPYEMRSQPIALPAAAHREAGTVILAVRVEDSPLRPHMVRGTGQFQRRGAGGTAEPMTYYEVRDQMAISNGTYRRLRMLRLELKALRSLARALASPQPDASTSGYFWPHRFTIDVAPIKQLLVDVIDIVPIGLAGAIFSLVNSATLVNGAMQQSFLTQEGADAAIRLLNGLESFLDNAIEEWRRWMSSDPALLQQDGLR